MPLMKGARSVQTPQTPSVGREMPKESHSSTFECTNNQPFLTPCLGADADSPPPDTESTENETSSA